MVEWYPPWRTDVGRCFHGSDWSIRTRAEYWNPAHSPKYSQRIMACCVASWQRRTCKSPLNRGQPQHFFCGAAWHAQKDQKILPPENGCAKKKACAMHSLAMYLSMFAWRTASVSQQWIDTASFLKAYLFLHVIQTPSETRYIDNIDISWPIYRYLESTDIDGP